VGLVRDIITQPHLQGGAEQLAVRHRRGGVPDLDDVEVTLGGHGDPRDGLIVCLEEGLGHGVNHAVDEHGMRVVGVHLLGPCAALVVLGRVPQGTDTLAHQEEHARVPCLGRDSLHHRPELCCGGELQELDVTRQAVVIVVGVVIPEDPRGREVGHSVCWEGQELWSLDSQNTF
jgi:hypothetical protein